MKYVDLSKFRGLDVKSFKVRVTNGNDTVDAAVRCVPLDDKPINNNLFGISMRQQILAAAIVEVDGKPITNPAGCQESIGWNARTREFLGETYDYLNGLTQKEREDFQAMLAASDAVPAASGSTTQSGG